MWTDCLDCEPTCENFLISCPSQCSTGGCVCPENYVLDRAGGECILKSDCPCMSNGIAYKSGDTIMPDDFNEW